MTETEKLRFERVVLRRFIARGWNIVLGAEAKGERALEGYALLFEMVERSNEIANILGDRE